MEQVNNVKEYLEKISHYRAKNTLFYRGQSEKYKNITSSISRDEGYTKNENLIYEEAIKMRDTEFNELEFPIEYLSKMQHYGIPTRLIDLSINPKIALYFAVENVQNEFNSNVYIFDQPDYSLDNKRIKLLSILSISNSLGIKKIKKNFLDTYSENITTDEILIYASKGVFVKYSKKLQKSNKRLFHQEGTFAICGNKIENEEIMKEVLPLNSITPSMIIRIPFEYKLSIKKELDKKYNINKTTIYPEFPSVGEYIREKYKKENYDLNKSYTILNVEDFSFSTVKRLSVSVVLKKFISIEKIKEIGINVIEQYKKTNDVVMVFIAKNGDEYIMKNWILRGQWVSNFLELSLRPFPLKEIDELGYSWDYNKSYSVLSDFYNNYAFEEDKILFVKYKKIFKKIEPYYQEILKIFENYDIKKLEEYIINNEVVIDEIYNEFGNLKYSRDNDFNEYLNKFQEISLHFKNIIIWLKKDELNSIAKENEILKCFEKANINFNKIKEKSLFWEEKLNFLKKRKKFNSNY